MNSRHFLRSWIIFAFALAAMPCARAAEPWPSIFNPLRILTVRLELDPQTWDDIKHDTNFYDPLLNIRVPCQLWIEGADTAPNSSANAITVQVRRKSDPALPSEADPQKVSLKIDINEYVLGQNLYGVKKLSLENGAGGNGVLKEGFAMNMHH